MTGGRQAQANPRPPYHTETPQLRQFFQTRIKNNLLPRTKPSETILFNQLHSASLRQVQRSLAGHDFEQILNKIAAGIADDKSDRRRNSWQT